MKFVFNFAIMILAGLLSFQSIAAAPVIDESDNFSTLDKSANDSSSFAANPPRGLNDEEEIALARDDDSNSTSNSALINQIKGLQQDVQELRGQLEVQHHQIQQLQKQQVAVTKDSGLNLANPNAAVITDPELSLELSGGNSVHAKSTNTALEPASFNPMQNNPADEQISYLAAYDLVKNKQFDEALQAMQNFVSYHPHGGYTANAHYWLGELYMVQKQYPKAIKHFETVLNQFPSSSKSAPSSLKIGYALAASGKEIEAKQRLLQVVKNYPDTPTAQLAFAKLNTLSAS